MHSEATRPVLGRTCQEHLLRVPPPRPLPHSARIYCQAIQHHCDRGRPAMWWTALCHKLLRQREVSRCTTCANTFHEHLLPCLAAEGHNLVVLERPPVKALV